MNHTLDTDLTLADLTRANPALIPFFARKGLDFCCGGDLKISTICASRQWDEICFLEEIEEYLKTAGAGPVPSWEPGSEVELIHYILERFHEGHRRDFEALADLMNKVLKAHGTKPPLHQLAALLQDLMADIEPHMLKEERILFPLILNRLGHPTGAALLCVQRPDGPIHVMRMEHDNVSQLLEVLVKTTNDFKPPEWACPTLADLFALLQKLDTEIRLHVHLENNVLFPMVQAMDWE